MTLVKTTFYCILVIGLIMHNASADETAIIDGKKVTVSGSKSAEERFKRYAEEHQQEAKKQRQFKKKVEGAKLGPLEQYVTGVFSHGFDWSQFEKFEYMDTEPLFRLLDDPDWIHHWSQTLGVIGAIADKKGAERLQAYILRDDFEGNQYAPSMDAKVAAIAALGRTVRRGVYPEGIKFLKAHANPGTWRSTLKALEISDRHSRRLHRKTIMVLSSIGTDDAVKTLEKVREAQLSTYTRAAGENELNKKDKKRLELIDLYIKEAKRGPLEERNYEK